MGALTFGLASDSIGSLVSARRTVSETRPDGHEGDSGEGSEESPILVSVVRYRLWNYAERD